MEDFSSTGQLVTLGLVDSSIGAMAKGLALVDMEALVAKDVLSLKHSMGHLASYNMSPGYTITLKVSRTHTVQCNTDYSTTT